MSDHDHKKLLIKASDDAALISSLLQNEGFRQVMEPTLKGIAKRLRDKILNGGCSSFDEYRATVEMLGILENEVLGLLFRRLNNANTTLRNDISGYVSKHQEFVGNQ